MAKNYKGMELSLMQHILKIYTGLLIILFPLSFAVTATSSFATRYSFSFDSPSPISSLLDTLESLQNAQNPVKKTLSKKTATSQGFITILGRCFIGKDTTTLLDSGSVEFIAKPVDVDDGIPYWKDSHYSGSPSYTAVKKGGILTGYVYAAKGQNYVLVIPHGYGLQWWDGNSIFEQPKPVSLTSDTVYCDFHFEPRCSLYCTISKTRYSVLTTCLVDKDGFNIVKPIGSYSDIAITDIPVGSYYFKLHKDEYYYANTFYPDAGTKSGVPLITFANAGEIKGSLAWTLRDSVYDLKPETTYGKLIVNYDSLYSGYYFTVWNLDTRRLFASSVGFKVDTLKLESNQKQLFGILGSSFVCWYPGTLFRSLAETLSVNEGGYQSITFPQIPPYSMLSGKLPVFTDKKLSFNSVLTLIGQNKSLGASIKTDSTGYLSTYATSGTYSLWNFPLTIGNKYAEGWGAFSRDSIKVSSNAYGFVSLGTLTSPSWNTYSIQGNVTCRKAVMVACYDTTGRVASATSIGITDYFYQKAGPRGRFFQYDFIEEKPYAVSYTLNCLSPGRYAVVKIELPEIVPGQSTVSWYGSSDYKWRYLDIDDLTLLTAPQNATWITVDGSTKVVTLPSWSSAINRSGSSRIIKQNDFNFRVFGDGRVQLQSLDFKSPITLKIYGVNGSLLGVFRVNASDPCIKLQQKYTNKPLLIEIDNGYKIVKKAFFTR